MTSFELPTQMKDLLPPNVPRNRKRRARTYNKGEQQLESQIGSRKVETEVSWTTSKKVSSRRNWHRYSLLSSVTITTYFYQVVRRV